MLKRLRKVYNNSLVAIDAYPAGLLESSPDGLGSLFTTVIREQFLRLRDADRFWFENVDNGQVPTVLLFALEHWAASCLHLPRRLLLGLIINIVQARAGCAKYGSVILGSVA